MQSLWFLDYLVIKVLGTMVLKKLIKWQELKINRTLLVLSGTLEDEDLSLNELSSVDLRYSIKITKLLRSGGRKITEDFFIL